MRGITIIKGNERIHTGEDLNLIQEVKSIGNPEVQSYLVEVPGRNGLLNLTKGLTGNVCYKNRVLNFQYLGTGSRADLLAIVDLFNSYHGETIKIIDDDTKEYYYEGEASVTITWSGTLLTIALDINANPFRERLELTKVSTILNSKEKDLVINNYGSTATPTVIVSDNAKIIVNNISYTLSKGTYKLIDLELIPGINILKVSGLGTLTVQYKEAKI